MKAQAVSTYDKYYRLNDRGFTRIDVISPDRWRTLNGKIFEARVLAFIIGDNLRATDLYEEHHDLQIEFTMSCNRQEAIRWMETWMMEAVAAGLGVEDFNLRAKFLAAYDLAKELRQ